MINDPVLPLSRPHPIVRARLAQFWGRVDGNDHQRPPSPPSLPLSGLEGGGVINPPFSSSLMTVSCFVVVVDFAGDA